jgi:gliding motility-associated-like protein
VNNIVGPGVVVSNITKNCNPNATGTFSATGTNLGITQGIILGTGKAIEAIGPNNSTGGGLFNGDGCFDATETFFDPNILNIEPLAKFDGCILEFDVKPACNILDINYVFASEEYPEYVGAGFNDVFGFFVSGPNPSGGNYNAFNIANIPGTGTPVSIDNINNLSNANLYVDNTNGLSTQYDGFTIPLVASVNVIPCQTYHLKLAIADAGDCDWSSAVFLAYQGLTCPNNQVPSIATTSNPIICSADGSASVIVSNYSGGITYNWQPGGQTNATATSLSAGTYTCTLGFNTPCPFTQTVSINVNSNNALNANIQTTKAFCGSTTGSASISVFGGNPPYTSIIWNTTPPQNGTTANQLSPGNYAVSITDNGGCTITKNFSIQDSVPVINTQQVIQNSSCAQANGSIQVTQVTGGTTPYTYSLNGNPAQNNGNFTGLLSGTYTVLISDANNCLRQQSFLVSDNSELNLSLITTDELCNKNNGTAQIDSCSGSAPFSYSWSHNINLNSSIATNLGAGSYSVLVTDALGCSGSTNFSISNQNEIFPGNVYVNPSIPLVDQTFTFGITQENGWTLSQVILPDGSNNSNLENSFTSTEFGYLYSTFIVMSDKGCIDTLVLEIFVKDAMTIYIPNSFTPNNDYLNEEWKVYGTVVKDISILVFNRWGELIFESTDLEKGWNGSFKGTKVQEDVYVK